MEGSFVQHSVRVLQELNKQRESGHFCDATLAVGSLVFKAHWSVLACCSSFFQGMYDGASSKIILPETFVEIFALLLDYFYTGHLAITPENWEKLLEAAKELCVPEAIKLCQEFQPGRLDDGDQNSQVSLGKDLGVCSKALVDAQGEPVLDSVPQSNSVQEAHQSPCIWGNKVSQGQRESPCLLRGRLKRAPKTNTLSDAGEVKNTLECKELRPLKRGATEDAGASIEQEAEKVLVSNDLPAEDGGGGKRNKETDEDYIPGKKSMRSKRRAHLARNSSGSKATGNGNLLETGALRSRRGTADPVECPTCHKSFLSKYYLKVHNRKHTGEKPFECSKCGKCYFRKENLLEHEARNCMSRSEQVFTCSVCQEVFKRRMELRLHMVSHTGEMPYKCSSCLQQFMQKKDLQSHLIKLHGAPKPHACPACSKCFLSRTELHLHEAFKHRGEKLFVCEECGHRASSRNGLQMHVKAKHRNERPYVCEFCQHAFTQKANLNMHLRTHTGEKPFQCHLCGKTFRTQASLDKHNRTHTGERPFSCEFCDQRFTERGPLLRHVASRHQEGRPHFCQICGKTFKAVEQLRVHVRRHKGVRKFECMECGYKFTRQAHLRRHMEIHDRVENYNPRQRKLRNLVIEDEKAVVVALQPPHILEVGSAEVIVESLAHSSLREELPEQRLCPNENFTSPEVIEQSLIITIPDDCET
ncbi:telomere zinc finger-associated protein isoform X1 [Varanus komodoensis]|uniref:telomere zinc finger-associated protein isoform X1 n=1 Tax=Varanus komodoensis TaxID=61221 RepID=UPI001CF773FF|nr:telomere zinc finger-associated protein isoform X1 [Varanus komodoensis]XP_044275595.1 telomere zinc finger-associated protein isoform X1 [Varanus komodoensis]